MTRLRRWAPWALLAVVAAVVLGIGLHRPSHPTLDSQVTHIANEVRCPVCDGETAAQSDAAPSVEIRTVIRQELQAGESSDQILSGLVRSYGKGILEKPQPTGIGLVVWVVPVIGAALGLAGLALAFSRWRERPWVESFPLPPGQEVGPAEAVPTGRAEPAGPVVTPVEAGGSAVAVQTVATRPTPPGLRSA